MKAFGLAALFFAFCIVSGHAQSQADDRYIGIYELIQRADQLAQTGEPGEALAAYTDAQTQLLQFQKVYPNWNPNIVSFRLNQVADKINELKPFDQARPKVPSTASPGPAGAAKTNEQTASSVSELDDLRTQLQTEREANQLLQSKLKEALSTRPAAVDASELTKAQEKIRWLMKQNDLLMSTRQNVVTTNVQTMTLTNVVKVFVTNREPAEVTRLSDAFNHQPQVQVVTNFVKVVVLDTNAMEMLKLERAAAVKNFNEEHDRAEKLADQLQRLQHLAQSGTNVSGDSELAQLRAENASLRKELQHLKAGTPVNTSTELAQARAQIATLKSENEILALEKMALQSRLQTLASGTNASASTAAYEARIRDLTQERNDLIERLDQANKSRSGKSSEAQAQLSALNQEVSSLRSRLAVVEAQPEPFTPEELKFINQATPPPSVPEVGKKSIKEMPAGTAELVASAQQHFARQQYDEAEDDYLKILDRDKNNVIALANLATIELQQGKLTDAEKHLKSALAESPDDAYSLSTYGYLKFQQGKFDEALNYLSRAAKLDSANPEIQNYLGATLNNLGQRKAAEAALRRAVQLAPNYAPAHNNLAVMYLSQNPPLPELARWHYQKAIDAGQPRNPELEKALADKGAPVQ